MILLRLACVASVVLSIAGATWWLYAVAVRQDWVGLAMGLAAAGYAVVSATGVIAIDRGLRRLHAPRSAATQISRRG